MNTQEKDAFGKWLTGFWEGDGSIGIYNHYVTGHIYPRLKVELSQKDLSVLMYVKNALSLSISLTPHRSGTSQLQICAKNTCTQLLEVFSQYIVSREACNKLNNIRSLLNLPLATEHPLSIDWLAGFWDADGTSGYATSFQLAITQCNRNILDRIRDYLGFGSVGPMSPEEYHWQAYGSKALLLAQKVLDLSHCNEKKERLRRHVERALTQQYIREHSEAILCPK